jgi:DNA replication protein DnaC
MRVSRRRENVLLLGNSGTGKTHIALALGLAACQRGHRVRFTTAAALVSELIEARDEKKLLRFQKQIASYELLIVDELGFVPLSKTGAELLFEMLSQRYERGSTMVTSNLPFQSGPRSRLRTAHRRPARPAHPSRPHPGDERRQLPTQAKPP